MTDLRKEARDRDCQIRVPTVCNRDNSTTVLAHLPKPGMGTKWAGVYDILGAWACSACHDAVDGRIKTSYQPDTLRLWHHQGVARTIEILISEGKIRV